jgi:hypothetical protein
MPCARQAECSCSEMRDGHDVRAPAAERMRRHRERKRQRLRLLHVLLRESEVDALIISGLLQEENRNDPATVTEALHQFFDRTLGRMRRSNASPW